MYKNDFYELLEISNLNEVELIYLSTLSKTLNILDKVQEHIFQFNPSYDETGRNEKFSTYYKRALISEIVYFLIETYASQEKRLDNEYIREDFENYFYDQFLNQEETFFIKKFLQKENLSGLDSKEVLNKLIKYENTKDKFDEYFENLNNGE